MDISVVICTYNRKHLLKQAINSLINQDTKGRFSFEIVVIDDGSTDGTENVVKEIIKNTIFPPVRYVREHGVGIAGARNRGIAESKANWIAFFDDDQKAETQFLYELYNVAIEKQADCVGGTVSLEFLCKVDLKLGPFCRSTLGELFYGDVPQKYSTKIPLGTQNVIINRKLFERVGIFDEGLLEGGEDADFFWRCYLCGSEIWYAPKAIVHHIIPSHRLERAHFKRQALYFGLSCARLRYKYKGRLRWFLALCRWLFRCLVRDVWFFLIAFFLRDKSQQLERETRLWCTVGYVRGSLHLIAPKIFKQRNFFESLRFRTRDDKKV